MRSSYVLPLVAALALAACGGGAEEDTAGEDAMAGEGMTSEEVAAESAGADMPRPGLYRTSQELVELEMPGMPEEMMGMMRSAFEEGAAEESTYCLTAEEAENAREEMLTGMAESDCDISRYDMSGGRIDAAMSCPTGEGVSGDVTMNGTMSSEGADMEMAFSHEIPGQGPGTIRMRVLSERIGECS